MFDHSDYYRQNMESIKKSKLITVFLFANFQIHCSLLARKTCKNGHFHFQMYYSPLLAAKMKGECAKITNTVHDLSIKAVFYY